MTDAEKLILARECAAEAKEGSFTAHLAPECIEEIREGGHDDWEEVQSALLAIDRMQDRVRAETERANAESYKQFTNGMEAAAEICGSLAETTYDDSDAFEAATGCEASIMLVVREQRKEQAAIRETPHEEG